MRSLGIGVRFLPIFFSSFILFQRIVLGVSEGKMLIFVIVAPWGRFQKTRKDLMEASKGTSEGGTGNAQAFWEWNEEQVRSYL